MKKFLALFIAALMVFGLCACGSEEKTETNDEAVQTEEKQELKGEETTWGNITLLLPDGMVLVEGSLGNDTDKNALTLQKDGDSFTYIMVSINEESFIDDGLNATKEFNSDCEFSDVSFELSNGTFSGFGYESYGYNMICLKGALSNGFVQITTCRFDKDDATLAAVLESLTIAD